MNSFKHVWKSPWTKSAPLGAETCKSWCEMAVTDDTTWVYPSTLDNFEKSSPFSLLLLHNQHPLIEFEWSGHAFHITFNFLTLSSALGRSIKSSMLTSSGMSRSWSKHMMKTHTQNRNESPYKMDALWTHSYDLAQSLEPFSFPINPPISVQSFNVTEAYSIIHA